MYLRTFNEAESTMFMVFSPIVILDNNKFDYGMKISQRKIMCYKYMNIKIQPMHMGTLDYYTNTGNQKQCLLSSVLAFISDM